MWREPGPGDILSRETDDLIWVGDKWVYGYNRGRHQLRRIHRWEKDRTDVVRALVLPQSSLALAKVFYERLGREWPKKKTRRYKYQTTLPNPHRPSRVRAPRVQQIPPERATVEEQSDIWEFLSGDRVQFRMRETALPRVRAAMAERHMVLVTDLTPTMGGHTVRPGMYVTDSRLLPDHIWAQGRTERTQDTDVIRVLVDYNPKSEGCRAWQRWETLRDGMSIREWGDVVGLEAARRDVLWALDRGQVSLEREGLPLVSHS